jgi:cell division protein FtsZ
MDLSIGEFQEVGNIVKQFASEDATVVVGTVIDPELTDVVRVTVVATGLGRPAASVRVPTGQALSGLMAREASREAHGQVPPMRVVSRAKPAMNPNYADLDKPTYQRQRAVGDGLRPQDDSEDLLDIPAFLRRQAD